MELLSIIVDYSGTQVYETVEALPQVSEALFHRHREVAEWSFILLRMLANLHPLDNPPARLSMEPVRVIPMNEKLA